MKQFYFFTVAIVFLLFSQNSWGQIKLGESPDYIDPSALLELESTTKGLLLPRMTSAQRDALPMDTSPVGLLIYNTDLHEIQYLFEVTLTNAKGEKRQELRWESATDDTIPFTRPTNPVAGQLFYDTGTAQLNLWDGSQWVVVSANNANSGAVTTTLSYQTLSLVGNQLTISNGNSIDLSSLVTTTIGTVGPQGVQGPAGPQGNPATDDQSLTASALSVNNIMTLAISDGNTVTFDFSDFEQELAASALSADSTMTLAISGGNTETIDLSALDQDLTLSSLSSNNIMTLAISDGNTVTFDLSDLDQDIAELNFNPINNVITVGITNGVSDTISLSNLGTTTIDGNLTVDGSISQVGTGTLHADYVFESYFEGVSSYNPHYAPPSLTEVEAFVKVNKHLPGEQSRAEIQTKGKWDVSENVRTNLEKVEELYLHTIEQQKEIERQKSALEKQQKEIDALKMMVQSLLIKINSTKLC